MTEQPQQQPAPQAPQTLSPGQFAVDQVNLAATNIGRAIPVVDEASPKLLIAAAQVQATNAMACALLDVASAVREGNTPGESIRYGVKDLASGLEGLLEVLKQALPSQEPTEG